MIKSRIPLSHALFSAWQMGDHNAQEELRQLFDATIAGQFDADFREQAPSDAVSVTTSSHLLTLTLLNQLYGLDSADFYKGDPERFVRTTLITQRLLGIRRLTLNWPVYAISAECLGQTMIYTEQHAPGVDPGVPLIGQSNWRDLSAPDFAAELPSIFEETIACFGALTALEPVAHLSAPYSLAADIFGQEALIMALLQAPDFVEALLSHLTEQIFVPWIDRLVQRFPTLWIELSDASASPVFIGPDHCLNVAVPAVQRLIANKTWGQRLFVANYRGDHLVKTAGGGPARRRNRSPAEIEQTPDQTLDQTQALVERFDFRLSVCPEFINKLDVDNVPISFYVEQAVQREKPLYLGVGATRIDRRHFADRKAAEQEIEALASQYAQAIKTVSESLTRRGHPRSSLAWPGDVFIEDINAETDFGLVKTIVETVAPDGKLENPPEPVPAHAA
ncbi:MAG: hypothetical protein GY764_08350 [Halieaceae bacterium]|nr:hypothetical protein [Halieaceae bacterium]